MINCTKKYDGSIVFQNINLTANRGDSLALVGANGSGKTTLLKAILGVISLDDGKIIIDENHSVGFFLDDRILYEELSIENNMKIYCSISGVMRNEREESIKRWLDYFGLYEYRKKKIKKLSAGIKKRLSLAISNLREPDILLMDEPFDELDSEYKEKFADLIKNKIHDGAIIIIASHNVELMKPLANRWIVLKDSILIEQHYFPEKHSQVYQPGNYFLGGDITL